MSRSPREGNRPVIALTQGDPAGIGPEILLTLLADPEIPRRWTPLLVAERAALEAVRSAVPTAPWGRFVDLAAPPDPGVLAQLRAEDGAIPVIDPVGRARTVQPGRPQEEDARGALAALDLGIELVRGRDGSAPLADALVTAPLNKATIAHHCLPSFRGHTEYLAAAAGLERYGRDYLMTFLAPDLRVALLTTHLSLAEAIAAVRRDAILEALRCLHRHLATDQPPRIAVAGLNPHAGEGGLLGGEEAAEIAPAVAAAREEGIDAHGPASPDSLFARARHGEFAWVLALYHDQGLIAVKTAAFGHATNWTLGLPFLRTSVDHGTAYEIAGRGVADATSLRSVIVATLGLISQRQGGIMGRAAGAALRP